jgi:ribose 5-phosphate isomerase B
MPRPLISEKDVLDASRRGDKSLSVGPSALITIAARDRAQSLGIELVIATPDESVSRPAINPVAAEKSEKVIGNGVVAVGSDHGGFRLKELLKEQLRDLGYKVADVGTNSEEPCDYPDFAYAVASLVSKGEAWRGIVIDGAGIGSAIVANKVPGVRAACCHNEFVARNSREHNDTNVLTLGSRVTGSEVAKEIVRIWLTTWFAGGRHKKRVDKILDVEGRFLKPSS